MFGAIGDFIKAKQLVSTIVVRKVFIVFCKLFFTNVFDPCIQILRTIFHPAHIIPGLLLLGVPYVSYSPYVCVAFITISFGFNGAVSLTNYANGHDLSPNFSGTLFAIINAVATTAGFLSPLVVAYFTTNGVSVFGQ